MISLILAPDPRAADEPQPAAHQRPRTRGCSWHLSRHHHQLRGRRRHLHTERLDDDRHGGGRWWRGSDERDLHHADPDATLTNEQASRRSPRGVVNATGTGRAHRLHGRDLHQPVHPRVVGIGRGHVRLRQPRDRRDGLLAIASINASGTPSATTFLRGDGTRATPPGGGTGGNYLTDTVTFAGKSDATKTVTAAWATTSKLHRLRCGDRRGQRRGDAGRRSPARGRQLHGPRLRPPGSHTGALAFYRTGL